jgi:hypothetical protein
VPLQQLSFHPCMHWKGLRLLSSLRAQETSCCTNFNSLCSELHLGTPLRLAPGVSLQYLVGSYGYLCTISVCHRAISVLQISPYSLLMFDSSSSCHNTCPSQIIGCQSLSPCCISLPLSGSSSILPQEITVTESNFFGEITTPSDP